MLSSVVYPESSFRRQSKPATRIILLNFHNQIRTSKSTLPKLQQNKQLYLLYNPHLRKTGGRGDYG